MYILVAALKEEVTELLDSEKEHLVISGLGKLKSLMAITDAFQNTKHPIECVINLGTAGSHSLETGKIVEVSKSYQRDTSFFSEPLSLTAASDLKKVNCGTGDRLETSTQNAPWEIVDMELYSLAFYCKEKSIPLISFKYITDANDENAYKNWKEKLPQASKELCNFWKRNKLEILARVCSK